MPIVELPIEPGITTERSDRTAGPRYKDCNLVRFRAGYPEKVGGWIKSDETLTVPGVTRNILDWVTLDGKEYAAFASTSGMYLYDSDTENLFVITPDGSVAIVENEVDAPFQTLQDTDNPTHIYIRHPAHTAIEGGIVSIANADAFTPYVASGSPTELTKLLKAHTIESVLDSDRYVIDGPLTATVAAKDLGGIDVWLEVMGETATPDVLNHPFLCAADADQATYPRRVTVVHPNHGMSASDKVSFRGATGDAQVTADEWNTVFDVVSVDIDGNHYTIDLPVTVSTPLTGERKGGEDVSFTIYPNGAAAATLDNPFTVTSGDRTIVVLDPSHSLAIDDLVMFTGSDEDAGDVSSMDLNDAFRVVALGDLSSADTANKYRIELTDDVTLPASTGTGGGDTVDIIRWAEATVPETHPVKDPYRFTAGSAVVRITNLDHGLLDTSDGTITSDMIDLYYVHEDSLEPDGAWNGTNPGSHLLSNMMAVYRVTYLTRDKFTIELQNIFSGVGDVHKADASCRCGKLSPSDYVFVFHDFDYCGRTFISDYPATYTHMDHPILTKDGSSLLAVMAPGVSDLEYGSPPSILECLLGPVEAMAGLSVDVLRPLTHPSDSLPSAVHQVALSAVSQDWFVLDLADSANTDPSLTIIATETTRGGGEECTYYLEHHIKCTGVYDV